MPLEEHECEWSETQTWADYANWKETEMWANENATRHQNVDCGDKVEWVWGKRASPDEVVYTVFTGSAGSKDFEKG